MIFDREPTSWRELQNFVGQLFTECDFETEISKVMKLVRGKKEVDVFAKDNKSDFRTEIIVECKYWNKPVDQETIHAFRTIVNDSGANVGFIISKNGFQKGAKEAVINTNIRLATLLELESEFYFRWKLCMIKKYLPFANRLFPYWDYSGKMPVDGRKIDYEKQKLIYYAYQPICCLMTDSEISSHSKSKYPISIPKINNNLDQIGEIEINSDRQYFDFIDKNKDLALLHFMILFREI